MRGPDVFGQVGAAGKLQLALVPAARVAQRLGPRGSRGTAHHCAAAAAPATAVAVEHGRGGAAAGRRALHVHEGTADAAERKEEIRF